MNIEQELRKAFQAGQSFERVTSGNATPLSSAGIPPGEDQYVRKALYDLSLERIVGLVEGQVVEKIEPTEDVSATEGYQ